MINNSIITIGVTFALLGVVYAPLMMLKLSVYGIALIGVVIAFKGVKNDWE